MPDGPGGSLANVLADGCLGRNEALGRCGLFALGPTGPLLFRGPRVATRPSAGMLAVPKGAWCRALLLHEADGSVAGWPFGLTAGGLAVPEW